MKKSHILLVLILVIFLIGLGGLGTFAYYQHVSFDQKVTALQKEISSLQNTTMAIASSTKDVNQNLAAAISSEEFTNRQAVIAKSQDTSLTSAVATAAPAVVSIVISENAPQYTVTYENPFGDDPMFQGLGIQVPVYHQSGTQLQKVGAGTGIIFRSDGYIVTNKHVIIDPKAQYSVLLSNGTQQNAQVVYTDPNNDIAVIKIPGTYSTVAHIGDSSTLQLGQTVAAIGNALGEYNNSVSVGIISGLNRSITAGDAYGGSTETLNNIIQTDAAINPGNSGGPLIDLEGNVVGINVADASGATGIGFSIPINSVKTVLEKYQ